MKLVHLIPLLLASLLAAAETPLVLAASGGKPDAFRTILPGEHEIHDSVRLRAVPASPPPKGDLVIEFDYFCVGGVDRFRVLAQPAAKGTTPAVLPSPGHSEAWSPYRGKIGALPAGTKHLRLEFGLTGDRVLMLKNARLREERPGEFDAPKKDLRSVPESLLLAELDRKYPATITRVEATASQILISGAAPGIKGPITVVELPIERLLTDRLPSISKHPVRPGANGTFSLAVPRLAERDGKTCDRLLSRWQLTSEQGGKTGFISHPRYAETVAAVRAHPPEMKPAHKKGLGGYATGKLPGELEELGISAITVNILLDGLLTTKPGKDTVPFTWQGRTFHARGGALGRHDATFREAAEKRLVVSAILLVANPARAKPPRASLLAHPDADPAGTYAMPNLTSEEGVAAYAGLINFLAERWSRQDGKFGRVHHWIIHNEVDAGWVWTNAGSIPAASFMDLYIRSMRLTDLIVRQYDPNARAFFSLTHHWADAGSPNFYGSKNLLELLARFTRAEGDFPWALAHHPYPESLRNPRTWEDKKATPSFDSPLITPKNIEVLDAWMRRPGMLYQGKVRPVHLSENGFNSRDYSENHLTDQAAGMAYAWKKIAPLESIEVWHYHNWIDNPKEGGLRIGLRKFPSEGMEPKPIWHLYRNFASPREDAACAPYLKTIGISSWKEIIMPSVR